MENIQVIITAISTVGFPIVCAAALFWKSNHTEKDLTDALNNNTLVMQKLCDKMDLGGLTNDKRDRYFTLEPSEPRKI